jgi:hypothetical protein
MVVLRFLRQPMAWLVAVPVVAGLSLALVGPGASGTPTHGEKATMTTTSVVSVESAASNTPVANPSSSGGTEPAWVKYYDGTAKSVREGEVRAAASPVVPVVESADLGGGSTTTTTAMATTTTIGQSDLGDLPPGVVSESSSPILLIVVAVCVVGIAVGGYWFWRRRRSPAKRPAR